MFEYTFSKFTHHWFKNIIDQYIYHLIKHILIKNSKNYTSKYIPEFILRKNNIYYFYKQKNINKNMLKFSLNKKYNIFMQFIGLFYISLIIFLVYYHIYYFMSWFDHGWFDLYYIYYAYFNYFYLYIYYIVFLKILLNSFCFDKFFSYNFLRFFNFSKQLQIADDLMDWEPSYFETIVINEEETPEDTSLYTMDLWLDIDEAFQHVKFAEDLETVEISYRFHQPTEWVDFKTYVIDSYDDYNLQYINTFIANYIEYWIDEDAGEEVYNYWAFEPEITLKI